MSPELCTAFGEIRKFYTLKLNVHHNGSAMQAVTIDKMFEKGDSCGIWKMLKMSTPNCRVVQIPSLSKIL